MDDLFGASSARFSSSFGGGGMGGDDLDLFQQQQQPPVRGSGSSNRTNFFQRKNKTLSALSSSSNGGGGGGVSPSPSSFDALFKPTTTGGKNGKNGGGSMVEEEVFEMSAHSAASTTVAASQSSFDAVFHGGGGGGMDDDDDFSSHAAVEFELDNPFLTSGQMKDAAVRILYEKSSSSSEEKARMLFLLDQLKKPAPPVLPPRLNSSATTSTSKPGQQPPQRRQPNAAARKRRAPNSSYLYNPTETALGLASSRRGFLPLLPLLQQFRTPGWRLRVELVRDLAWQLKLLHSNDKAHNGLHLDQNALVAVDSFKGCLADDTGAVSPAGGADVAGFLQKRDVLMLGRVLLLLACGMSPLALHKELDKFDQLVVREQSATGSVDADYELNDQADQQVRQALAKALTPGSLLELCAQCCSGDASTRPQSEDAWDWLDSIVGDMHTAAGGAVLPEDQAEDVAKLVPAELVQQSAIKAPKLLDVYAASTAYEDEDGASSVSASSTFTNDSFQPPSDAEATGATFNKSRLSGFLNTSTDTPAGGLSRSRSLSNFLNNSSTAPASPTPAPIAAAGQEAWQQERTRRRSLDRGYMWAKGKLEGDASAVQDEAALREQRKLKRQTLNKQLVVTQDVSKFQQARYQVAPASKNTRKCDELAKLFANQERIPQEEALGILKKAEQVLRKERNLLELKPPVVVVGDIHGQFFDLLNMLRLTGGPGGKAKTSYLFLGDYVDRGDFSCEVILYLLALKCEFPDHVFLLRGNHECRTVSSYFGFKEECEMKYGPLVFNRCVQVFQVMPIAAVIDSLAGRFLCLHGGISPNFTSLEQFKEFDRFIEPGMNGFLCDILWSDPVKDGEEGEDKLSLAEFLSIDYLPNPARGCSYRYGFKALVSFLAVNKLVCLIRAHEVQMGGYRYHFQELTGGGGGAGAGGANKGKAVQMTPPVVTVFSAPNYTGKYGNLGAVLKVHAQPPGTPATAAAKKKAGAAAGTGFRPLELVEPIQYQQVDNIPPPMQPAKHEHQSQVLQITHTCPYMPTTFRAFIKSALELAEEDEDESILARQKQRASRQLAPVAATTVAAVDVPQIQEYEDELDALVARAEKSRMSLSAKLAKTITGAGGRASLTAKSAASSEPPVAAAAASVQAPHGPQFVKQADRIKASKFEAAADNDGMNEMNPDLIAEKMAAAQKKIAEKQLAGVDAVKVFKAGNTGTGGGGEGRTSNSAKNSHHLGKSPSATKLVVGDKTRPESLRASTAAGTPSSSMLQPPTINEDDTVDDSGAMSFSSKELLALQLLFLLIDREDKGLIDQDDLLAWSAEEGGYPVQPFEAEICLKAVDSDEDGKIGFEDYLAFAARSKDRWLVSEYETILRDTQYEKKKELSWDQY